MQVASSCQKVPGGEIGGVLSQFMRSERPDEVVDRVWRYEEEDRAHDDLQQAV